MMSAIKTGKSGGIKQFLKGKKSYKTTHTITRDKDDLVTFDLWIVCKYKKGKRKQHGVQYFVYVIHKVKTSLSYNYKKSLSILCVLVKEFGLKSIIGYKIFSDRSLGKNFLVY